MGLCTQSRLQDRVNVQKNSLDNIRLFCTRGVRNALESMCTYVCCPTMHPPCAVTLLKVCPVTQVPQCEINMRSSCESHHIRPPRAAVSWPAPRTPSPVQRIQPSPSERPVRASVQSWAARLHAGNVAAAGRSCCSVPGRYHQRHEEMSKCGISKLGREVVKASASAW